MENSMIEDKVAEVREIFPNVVFPEVREELAFFGMRTTTMVPDVKAIVGTSPDTGEEVFYRFVSDQYQLIPHEVALWEIIHGVIPKMEDTLGKEFDAKIVFPKDGAKMYSSFNFPNAKPIKIKNKDVISQNILGFNSYDMSTEFQYDFGATRLICENGMRRWESLSASKTSGKHRLCLDPEMLASELHAKMTGFKKQTEFWKHLTTVQVDSEIFPPLWEALPFGVVSNKRDEKKTSKHRENILALPQAGIEKSLSEMLDGGKCSAWNVYNSCTEYVTHNKWVSEVWREDRLREVEKVFQAKFNN